MPATARPAEFLVKVTGKVREQLSSQRVGYLFGAGSSYLAGRGYPLAAQLWSAINDGIPEPYRAEIEAKLNAGANGIEEALDLLDRGQTEEQPHRRLVTDAIAEHFITLSPPTDLHVEFLRRLMRKREPFVHIFNLNYDPLIELAADECRAHFVDGFRGIETPFFDPGVFQQSLGIVQRTSRTMTFRPITGVIHHYKLHGSLGWYECPTDGIRRCAANSPVPPGTKRLMIPPQHRKVMDTLAFPYEALWSEFRKLLRHGPPVLNRLAVIGYGMRDSHVNAVLDNALARPDFTLLVFARTLSDEVFQRWQACPRAIIVTENRCSLYTEKGVGHPSLWDFAQLTKEI